MKFLARLTGISLAVYGLIYFLTAQGEPLPAFAMDSNNGLGTEECTDTQRCIYVYLAPW